MSVILKPNQYLSRNHKTVMSDSNAMELESLDAELPEEILNMSTADLEARTRLLDNEVGKLEFSDNVFDGLL